MNEGDRVYIPKGIWLGDKYARHVKPGARGKVISVREVGDATIAIVVFDGDPRPWNVITSRLQPLGIVERLAEIERRRP